MSILNDLVFQVEDWLSTYVCLSIRVTSSSAFVFYFPQQLNLTVG